jgi:hypothetical protein
MPIKLDISKTLVVIYCSDCPHWRACAWTPDEGRTRAAIHETNVHPESFQVRNQIAKNERRHAEQLEPTPSMP